MIEIVIDKGTLILPADLKLSREVVSLTFTKQKDAYDFTYPIDFPLTPDVRKILGFPDEMANASIKKEYNGDLIIDGVWVANAKISVLSASLSSKTCRITMFGNYRSLYDIFGTARVCDLKMGGFQVLERSEGGFEEINYTFGDIVDGAYNYGKLKVKYRGAPVNAYMRAVAKGTIVTDFLFPKAVDISSSLPGNQGYSIINAYDHDRDRYVDADLQNAMFSDWKSHTASNYQYAERHFWVPMFKLISVLKSCFSEFGITLEGDLLTDPKFKDIVLFNTHAINNGVTGSYIPGISLPAGTFLLTAGNDKAYLTPGNHLPRMKIIEFLIELGKRYNWQITYDPRGRIATIKEDRKLLVNPTHIIDLSNRINTQPVLNFEYADAFLNGYQFSFEGDPDDSATSTDVAQDVSSFAYEEDFDYRGELNQESDLGSIVPGTKDLVFIRNINTFFKRENEEWIIHSHNIAPYRTIKSENLQDVSTKIVSNPMQIFSVKMITFKPGYGSIGNDIGASYLNDWESVPFSNIGMSFDRYDYIDWSFSNGIYYYPGIGDPWSPHIHQERQTPREHYPHVVTCAGFQPGINGSDRTYFFATSGRYNSRGTLLNIYSGSWDGLVLDWWDTFIKYFSNSYSADFEVSLDIFMYSKIDVNRTLFKINSLNFLCKKVNFNLPFPSVSTMSLVRV